MSRHEGVLPEEYKEQLGEMTPREIATEAAHFRSDGRRPGTATALILRWGVDNIGATPGDYREFFEHYRQAWKIEKIARSAGISSRPADRPAIGQPKVRSRRRARMGFADVPVFIHR